MQFILQIHACRGAGTNATARLGGVCGLSGVSSVSSLSRGRDAKVPARQTLSARRAAPENPEVGYPTSEYDAAPPSDDPIDKFLYRLQLYARDPKRAFRDFARFAVDSCRLMVHVSKPSMSETVKTAVLVLMVVALFVGVLHASNVGLLSVRGVGQQVFRHGFL